MTSWHPSFVPSGGPRGLVLVHVRDDTDHLELRGTLQLTKREYEDLAARVAAVRAFNEAAAHLATARADWRALRQTLFAALGINPEARPLPSVPEMVKQLAAEVEEHRRTIRSYQASFVDDDDLHDMHPQPGDAPAAPLPAGVEGFAVPRPRVERGVAPC